MAGRRTAHLLFVLAVVAAAGLSAVVPTLPRTERIAPLVYANLEKSGAAHPITSVLLNFRAHDTLLEITVLFTAAMAVFLLAPKERMPPLLSESLAHGPEPPQIAAHIAPWLAVFAVLLAGHLWWAGSSQPGGAFQAGIALAATGIILSLTGWRIARSQRSARAAMGLGVFAFALTALVPSLSGLAYLELPQNWAKIVISVLEGILTMSIAICLAELVFGIPRHRA